MDKSKNELKASEEPQMRVTLEPEDVSEHYFPASYKSSSVKISGGTFVSARRDGDDLVVTLRVKGIKGDFGQPEEAFWNENNLGEARWEEPENSSGYYELQLLRDGKQVYKVAQTSSRQYRFYPYMTEAGDYTFKVRSIPVTDAQKKYGGKSEWTESGELTITERYVSDGKGKEESEQALRPEHRSVLDGTKGIPGGRSVCRTGAFVQMNGIATMDYGITLIQRDGCRLAGIRKTETGIICIPTGRWPLAGER